MPFVSRCFLSFALCAVASGAVYQGDPSNYKTLLSNLQAGDTLNLAAGSYPRLNITNLRGTPAAWITVTGPTSGAPAVVTGNACCNTVEISNSSYVSVQNLTIDSLGIDGVAGISAKDGSANLTHDIRILNNILVGQGFSQQTNGISTKTPTWGWVIRGNTIIGAGTGMYLGNSDGSQPFVAGIIENNLIKDTIGYNMQIKFQLARPSVSGMPTGQSYTIIRNNVFIKNDQPSPDGDRPNVLVGGFPDSGPGSTDMYEVYGNFFYHNPREALFQASGRVSVHDNIFVDGVKAAAVFQNHDLPLRLAYVYNNTVYTSGRGIYFGSQALADDAVVANLAFGGTPISGAIRNPSNNITDTFANASLYVKAPSFTLGVMDFFPLAGKAQGAVFDLSKFILDPDYAFDFNGTSKNSAKQAFVFRGAYAGEGTNPGWKLQAGIKNNGGAPTAPVLTGLACTPASVPAGQSSTCAISLSGALSTAATVQITSTDAALTVPASVTVAAGSASASFTANAGTVTSDRIAVLTATLAGGGAPVQTSVTVLASTTGGALTTSITTPPATANLTVQGTSDWIHWGLATAASVNRKAGVVSQIGNFTAVGSGTVSRYANNSTGFTWTDGTPTASTTASTTGVFVSGQGNGFRVTAPADATTRTLQVYVGAWRSQGRLVAHLSDGSSADYVDTSLSNTAGATTLRVYTFVYHAASSAQSLIVTFTQESGGGGNVTLQAATLGGAAGAPGFTVSAAPATRTVIGPGTASYSIGITALNGFAGAVSFSVSGLPAGVTSAFAPPSVTGSGSSTLNLTVSGSAAPGTYLLTVTAAGGGSTRTTNVALVLSAPAPGGLLAGSVTAPPGTVNLTAAGTADWAHWGLAAVTDFNHKAGVAQQISNYTRIGSATVNRYANNSAGFSWTGGTPAVSASNTTTGIYVNGQDNGFRVTVPADTTTRTIRVYVGAFHTTGKMAAHLSDGSAVDFVDASLTNTAFPTTLGVYTLTYRAASGGQTLTVTFTNTGASGNVTLQAATLQ